MNNLFDILFEISDSANSLDRFLDKNMQIVSDFYNSSYRNVAICKESIENYILLRNNAIAQLDFSRSYAKSFVLMLLDYCERFNLIAATPRIYSILLTNNIAINNRQQAALLFLYPKPVTNSKLIELFNSICSKLQYAIDAEEDDDKHAISTFLNYYSIVVNDTGIEYAEEVKEKLVKATDEGAYPFLKSYPIPELPDIDLQDTDAAYTQIQCLIDKLLEKKEIAIDISQIKHSQADYDEVLIETDTPYSGFLQSVSANFDSIRALSIHRASGTSTTKRGVKILNSEPELFEYMKRFGNMHKAKLQAAYSSLPDTFPKKVNLIDWGCGQGFASMLFIEQFGYEAINNITLIEPSEIVIKRAALHVRKYNSTIALKTICKKLDDLSPADLRSEHPGITIHLFSNILDIDDYSQQHLIELIESMQTGRTFFICVSPYIDEIKTERLESFKRYFETEYETFNLLSDITNSKKSYDTFWNCNNTYNHHLVSHGSYPNCKEYTVYGCSNKWTRIIKVFYID